MKKQLNKVADFQRVFVGDNNKTIRQIGQLRYDLMAEENQEYLDAVKDADEVGVADALGDMLYILLGTIHEHRMGGIIESVFDEIHDSNMSKLGENGVPLLNGINTVRNKTKPYGKVMKGPNYKKPDIESIVTNKNKRKWKLFGTF